MNHTNTNTKTATTPRVHIRWVLRCDLPAVLNIEKHSFEFPWTEEQFVDALRCRNVIGLVAEAGPGDAVAGFVIYELAARHITLLNLAVDPLVRRQGVGLALVEKMKSKISPAAGKRQRLELILRETNVVSQLFFRAQGFRCEAIEHDFYDDCDDDAYFFEFTHPDANPSRAQSR